jgi:hypothetical protein
LLGLVVTLLVAGLIVLNAVYAGPVFGFYARGVAANPDGPWRTVYIKFSRWVGIPIAVAIIAIGVAGLAR